MSTTRRSKPSANTLFGNKMAVLAGDFLLGRASVALARLRDPEVTELLATVIANLVEGEFMLTEFIDRFGPRMAHLNGILQVLSQLSAVPNPATPQNSP